MDDSNAPTPTCKQGRHLRVPVLPDEEAAIKDNAAQAGMSVAAYLLAVALGSQVRSVVDNQQVEALVKISGELERLSKLLEYWKSHDPRSGAPQGGTLITAGTADDRQTRPDAICPQKQLCRVGQVHAGRAEKIRAGWLRPGHQLPYPKHRRGGAGHPTR